MSASATKRRKKNYYVGSASKRAKSNSLDNSTGPGFLITIDPKQERRATLKAYSLLNEAADRLYGAEVAKPESTDIEAELKDLRENNFRFQKVRTDFPSNVFIKSSVGTPVDLCKDVFEHMPTNVSHIVRLVPVLGTCKSPQDVVSKKVLEILAEQFPVVLSKQTFMVQLKARQNNDYNSSEEKQKFCLDLAKKIQEWNADFVPDLKTPELVIHIDVLKRVTCVALLSDYSRFKKYNPEQFNDKCSTEPMKEPVSDAPTSKENEASEKGTSKDSPKEKGAPEEKEAVIEEPVKDIPKEDSQQEQ